MAKFQIKKTKNYTTMSNFHFKDKKLSLKAKGLLSQMLSLPDDWDYTLKGLAKINQEGIEAIRTAVIELEKAGYIIRTRNREDDGTFSDITYDVYEKPQKKKATVDVENSNDTSVENSADVENSDISASENTPKSDYPISENRILDKIENIEPKTPISCGKSDISPKCDFPILDNQIHAPYILNTKVIKSNQSINPIKTATPKIDKIDRNSQNLIEINNAYIQMEANAYLLEPDEITKTPEYKELVEIAKDIITESFAKNSVHISGVPYPSTTVRNRILSLKKQNYCYALKNIQNNTTEIKNPRAYLRATIYNATTTQENHFQMFFQNNFHGDKTMQEPYMDE